MRVSFAFVGALLTALSIVMVSFTQFPEVESSGGEVDGPSVPMVVSGDNVYIVWWTNTTGNWEVMFRASDDHGSSFGDMINLSNSSETDSMNANIVAEGYRVFVSWWENSLTNGTGHAVMRLSEDNGVTFGPINELSTNVTIISNGGSRSSTSDLGL
jgi:hypothetical protein